MPLFLTELNRLANEIRGSVTLTVYLHNEAPEDGNEQQGRLTRGGEGFENGVDLPVSGITHASNGGIANEREIDFGTANDNLGVITHWSLFRGTVPVAWGALASSDEVQRGDSYRMRAGTLQINGATV